MSEKIDAASRLKRLISEECYSPYELMVGFSQMHSSVLNLPETDQAAFQQLFDELDSVNLSVHDKGKKLEDLINLLFRNPKGSLFECRRNVRTSSNEIDLLLSWNKAARDSCMNQAYPMFGESFLCECKNYNGRVDVTYVGKFYSLLSLSGATLGLMIAWEGITGTGNWDAAKGLIKKIALKSGIYIIALDKDDLREIRDGRENIYSLVCDKYNALRNDIDFSEYVKKHPAEDELLKNS